jgi:hypothetical protein
VGRRVIRHREGPALRVIQGLCALARKHRESDLESACEAALSREQWRLEDIRRQLQQRSDQTLIRFDEAHALIRPLSAYGALVGQPFGESTPSPLNA